MFTVLAELSDTWKAILTAAGIGVCLLPMVLFHLWPVFVGGSPVIDCGQCPNGRLVETGRRMARRWRLQRKEYECEICGHREWLTDFYCCLSRQLDTKVCSRCGKTILRDTGKTKIGRGFPFVYLEEGECSHCGNKEWYYKWSFGSGGGG